MATSRRYLSKYAIITSYRDWMYTSWQSVASIGDAATLASQLNTDGCTVTVIKWEPIELTTKQLIAGRERILAEIDGSLSDELEKILQGE